MIKMLQKYELDGEVGLDTQVTYPLDDFDDIAGNRAITWGECKILKHA